MSRYHRQTLLPQIGQAGQEKLRASRVLLVGCGALGTVIAEQLVRAGVGHLRLCDRDVVEMSNLQRQTLFTEADAEQGVPKAVAAAGRLAAINSSVTIEPHVADAHSGNIETLAAGIHLILDGTDNVETRYLVNDVAVKLGLPWVYGACVGMGGRVVGFVPGVTPCLRCIFPEPPGPGETETCDTAGVFAPAAAIVASLQVAAAVKIVLGQTEALPLTTVDAWAPRFHHVSTAGARRDDCPTCGKRKLEFLEGPSAAATSLCGRDTVQVRPASSNVRMNADEIERRLAAVGRVERTPFLIRCALREGGLKLTVFMDGRALVQGTNDLAAARSAYARYIGA